MICSTLLFHTVGGRNQPPFSTGAGPLPSTAWLFISNVHYNINQLILLCNSVNRFIIHHLINNSDDVHCHCHCSLKRTAALSVFSSPSGGEVPLQRQLSTFFAIAKDGNITKKSLLIYKSIGFHHPCFMKLDLWRELFRTQERWDMTWPIFGGKKAATSIAAEGIANHLALSRQRERPCPLVFPLKWTISGWWFGTWILWLSILLRTIPHVTNIFQRGRSTTNQIWIVKRIITVETCKSVVTFCRWTTVFVIGKTRIS